MSHSESILKLLHIFIPDVDVVEVVIVEVEEDEEAVTVEAVPSPHKSVPSKLAATRFGVWENLNNILTLNVDPAVMVSLMLMMVNVLDNFIHLILRF